MCALARYHVPVSKTLELHLNPQWVCDEAGQRQSVLLSLAEFEALLAALEDVYDAQVLEEATATSTGFERLEELGKRLGFE